MLKLLKCSGYNTNEHYDPSLAHNGGGYWQPSGEVEFSTGLFNGTIYHITVQYIDTSCGEFGSRIFYGIRSSDNHMWVVAYNDMDDDQSMSHDEIEKVARSFYLHTGEDLYILLHATKSAVENSCILVDQINDMIDGMTPSE